MSRPLDEDIDLLSMAKEPLMRFLQYFDEVFHEPYKKTLAQVFRSYVKQDVLELCKLKEDAHIVRVELEEIETNIDEETQKAMIEFLTMIYVTDWAFGGYDCDQESEEPEEQPMMPLYPGDI